MKKTFSPSGEMAIKSVSVLEKLALGNQKGASSISKPLIDKILLCACSILENSSFSISWS